MNYYKKYVLLAGLLLFLIGNATLPTRAQEHRNSINNSPSILQENHPRDFATLHKREKSAAPIPIVICNLHVDYPHKSAHEKGKVNVVARTVCTGNVSDIEMTINLTRDGNIVSTSTFTNAGNILLIGYTATPCVSGLYQGEATATVNFLPGSWTPRNTLHAVSDAKIIDCQ